MKKYILVGLFFLLVGAFPVYAKQGCCSHHGGVAGCNSYDRTICKDGTLSPTCTCTPQIIYGCTDSNAKNYNRNANQNDGSCIYYKKGCTDKNALNYDINAEKDDGSCITTVLGCMDKTAKNYNENANQSDDSCIYYKKGCTDKDALNYDEMAEKDDGTCITKITGCMDEAAINYNPNANSTGKCTYDNDESESNGSIIPGVLGVGLVGTIAVLIKKRKFKLF